MEFKNYLKEQRVGKGLLVRNVAQLISVDASLISRFEKGERLPTKIQAIALANALQIDKSQFLTQWAAAKIIAYIQEEDYGIEALQVAEEQVKLYTKTIAINNSVSGQIQSLLKTVDNLKETLQKFRKLSSYKIVEALEMEYTYESNKIEGNTLTLQETDVVINEGITISGKSMREHLEAINHHHAIDFVKYLVQNKNAITESNVLQIHNLVLRGIDVENAGRYRNVQVMIKGSKHVPPQAFIVPKQMEDLFIWYKANKNKMHPVVLAAEMHERLVTIHPFIDGNGRTSRLLMNLILLQNGYVIANIKGDNNSRLNYYKALEDAQTTNNKNAFIELVTQVEIDCLKHYLNILGVN